MKKKSIRRNRKYKDFCLRYRDNPKRYMFEVGKRVGLMPTWQQCDLLDCVAPPGSRTACSSGHGTGKSVVYGFLSDWHLRVYPMSLTVLTANNITQVGRIVWRYISKAQEGVEALYPWMRGHFVKETKLYFNVHNKGEWFVEPRTAPVSKPEGVAGYHNRNYLLLIDEASAQEDAVMEVWFGGLTERLNRLCMISQYTRLSGQFHEAFTKQADLYNLLQLNAEESPLVTTKSIKEWLIRYNGFRSPQYQIRVLGRRADNLSGFLLPMSRCEEAQHVKPVHSEDWGWVITVDVGEGVHRDSSVMTVGKVSGYDPKERVVEPIGYKEVTHMEPKKFARDVVHYEAGNYPFPTIAVDADGPGGTVAAILEDLGHNVQRIRWGRPPHSERDKRDYQDLRAYAHEMARDAVVSRRMNFPPGKKILEQASRLPYEIDRFGRLVIMPKKKMKAEGIDSPDIWDTLCFFFLADFTPVSDEKKEEYDDEMLEWAENMLRGEDIDDGLTPEIGWRKAA